ncbi:FAD-dependent monooxygenase, partial [Acinetobacter baumannii]
ARYDFLSAAGEVLLRLDGADQIGSGGWPIANMIHQPSIEALLREAAASEHVAVRDCWAFVALTQGADGVTATFDTSVGERSVRARYII